MPPKTKGPSRPKYAQLGYFPDFWEIWKLVIQSIKNIRGFRFDMNKFQQDQMIKFDQSVRSTHWVP